MTTTSHFKILINNVWESISIQRTTNLAQVSFRERQWCIDFGKLSENEFSLLVDGRSHDVTVHRLDDHSHVTIDGVGFDISLVDPKRFQSRLMRGDDASGPVSVSAPMPGKVVRLLVQEGDSVQAGQGVVVIEAMKMQNELRSPKSGKIEEVCVSENQAVNAGESLLVVK